MSFSKPSLVILAALALVATAAHADSFTTGSFFSGNQTNLGSSAGFTTFSFDGHTESGAAGNFTGSTGVVNGVETSFADVYCVDLNDTINLNTTYKATYSTTGVVNGSKVNNAGEIAWLLTNLAPEATTTAENMGLQAAIWKIEYGSNFNLITSDNSAAVDAAYAADLAALGSNTEAVSSVLWMSPSSGSDCDGQGQVILPVSPVPEPATLTQFGTGLLGLAGKLRRRSSASVV